MHYHVLKSHDTTEHTLRFQKLSLKSETSLQLIDIAKHLSDFTVVDQFIQENGIEDFESKIGHLQERIRIFNLGWHFFSAKVALDTLFLSSLWTKLSEILNWADGVDCLQEMERN